MRMPLVFSITCLMGRRRAAARMSRICGWMVGSPPEICTRSGSPSLLTRASSMNSTSAEAAMAVPLGRGIGEAHRTGEVAGLVDLDDGQARMLLVVGAEAAIPRAAALGAGERRQRPVAGLEVFQRAPPVDRVVRHQGLHHAVLGAALGIVDAAVLLDDLGRHQAETGLAERGGLAEEEIRCRLARYAIVHALLPRRIITAAYRTRPRHTKWNRLKGPASVA